MLGELLPTGGGDPIPFLKTKLLVGRRESCDISLRFPNVSSHHCELELINGYWRVRDLGSRNGTKVNGIRVESTWLLPGDELSVAKHSYEVRYSATGEVPPPEVEDIFSMSLLEKAGLSRRPEPPEPDETEDIRAAEGLPASNDLPPASSRPAEQNISLSHLSDDEAAMLFLNEAPTPRSSEQPASDAARKTPPNATRGEMNSVRRVRQSPPPARPEPPVRQEPSVRQAPSGRHPTPNGRELEERVATRWIISDEE